MNRFAPREGTPAPYTAHMLFISDSVDQALRGVLADYLARQGPGFTPKIDGRITVK